MENKKLINILTKDMGELEELIAETKAKRQFNPLEMEFIHTRAKGILQLLQMLNTSEESLVKSAGEEKAILDELKEKVKKVSKLTSELEPKEIGLEIQEAEQQNGRHEQFLTGMVQEPSGKQDENLPAEEKELAVKDDESFINRKDNEDEPLAYEADKPEVASRLGDSFLKSKSVNDLITEQVKLEYKLSNRPVSSIQSSIGINDRFQYIRELFDGDSKKFVEAVKTLDSMENIRDAVDYLRNNFKWKKNESSLKFVNLVKRRFQNDISA